MKALIKWLSILVGLLAVLIIGAIVLIPQLVDIQQYKPEIEKNTSKKGRKNRGSIKKRLTETPKLDEWLE